jgi:hypothetical protein
MANYSLTLYTNRFFASVFKSPTHAVGISQYKCLGHEYLTLAPLKKITPFLVHTQYAEKIPLHVNITFLKIFILALKLLTLWRLCGVKITEICDKKILTLGHQVI